MTRRSRIDASLKSEFDNVLLENQELHRRLRRFDEFHFLLRALANVARREIRRLLPRRSRAHAELAHGTFQKPTDFATSFRPYRVRQPRAAPGPRPRVLHAIGNVYTGGAARLVVDLVERLGDRFEHVTLVRDEPARPHYIGLQIHAVPHIRPRAALALLRQIRPDLITVHFLGHHRHPYSQLDWEWYDDLFEAAGEYGCPVVENVMIPVAPYYSDVVNCYVFVSDYVRTLFGRDGSRNITIYPGSNFELFSRRPGAAPPDACVGMVYRLEKDKLDETAIDVFIEVLRRRPEATALIVGGGRLLDTYRGRVEDAGLTGSVKFTAYVAYEDLPRLYEQMTIFVAPPHRESFGHVVPLAMNMAIPVAAYAVGALPEILGDDDVLAPPGDVGALATKVVELLDDPERRRRAGAANRERAQRLFSIEKMVGEYRALYDELLNGSGR